MKVKATVSFAGEVTMAVNEVRELPEAVASPLLSCGYVIPAEKEKKTKKPAEKNEEQA